MEKEKKGLSTDGAEKPGYTYEGGIWLDPSLVSFFTVKDG